MCGEVESIDLGWMKGVICHDAGNAIKLRLLRECTPFPDHVRQMVNG